MIQTGVRLIQVNVNVQTANHKHFFKFLHTHPENMLMSVNPAGGTVPVAGVTSFPVTSQ